MQLCISAITSCVHFQDGVTNLKGILFFFCSELTYPTVYGIQTYMPSEFSLLVREYHDGSYPVLAYYIAKVSFTNVLFNVSEGGGGGGHLRSLSKEHRQRAK